MGIGHLGLSVACSENRRRARARRAATRTVIGSNLVTDGRPSYTSSVSPEETSRTSRKLWKPHPDDEADVREAMESVDRGEILSVEASEAFLRWLEGGDDESWRDECR